MPRIQPTCDFVEFFSSIEDGRYKFIEPLGEGGMAVVYLFFDTMLDTHVAVKVVHKHLLINKNNLPDRFMREARLMHNIHHPHIVRVTNMGDREGFLYMVMEFLPHGNIWDYIMDHGALSVRVGLSLTIRMLEALEAVHTYKDRGLVHRDVKPANILIGEGGIAKLSDFGVAHDSINQMTKTGATVGSMSFMSPELMADGSKAHVTDDLYALACTLNVLLKGPEALRPMMFVYLQKKPDEFYAGLHGDVARIIKTAVAKDVSVRYQSARAMIEAIEPVLAQYSEDPRIPFGCVPLETLPPLVQPGHTLVASDELMVPCEPEAKPSVSLPSSAPGASHLSMHASMNGSVAGGVQSVGDTPPSSTQVSLLKSNASGELDEDSSEPVILAGSETLFGEDPLTEEVRKRRKKRFVFIPAALLLAGVFGGVAWWMLREPVHDVEAIHESPDVQESVVQAVGGIHESPDVHGSLDLVPEPEVIEAPVPEPKPVVVQTMPDPDPVHAPDPEPVVQAAGGIHESPDVYESSDPIPEPEVPMTAQVSFTGADAVWLIGGDGRVKLPAEVPVDIYQVDADFGAGAFPAHTNLKIEAGKDITLVCDAAFASCDP